MVSESIRAYKNEQLFSTEPNYHVFKKAKSRKSGGISYRNSIFQHTKTNNKMLRESVKRRNTLVPFVHS